MSLLFSLLSFIISPSGLFALLSGLLLFIVLPFVPAVTGVGRPLARLHLWFAMWSLQRAAIVVSEHGELLIKSMQFDDIGVETISFGDETKEFEDPAARLSHWMGFPFALADEPTGILFDPRDAAIGDRKDEFDKRDIAEVESTRDTFDEHGIDKWVPGVFELDKRHELVDLSKVRSIIAGGERAEYPQRIEELYKLHRQPFNSNRVALKLLLPVGAFVGIMVMFWQIGSQGGGGGGGGTTVTGPGASLLYLCVGSRGLLSLFEMSDDDSGSGLGEILSSSDEGSNSASERASSPPDPKGSGGEDRSPDDGDSPSWVNDVDFVRVAKILALALPLPLLFVSIGLFVSPIIAVLAATLFAVGFLTLPVLTVVGRASTIISGGLAKYLYLKLGLLAYDRPVWRWTPAGYELVEYDELDGAERVTWYGLVGSVVGFTFEPDSGNFDASHVDTEQVKEWAGSDIKADGGDPPRDPTPDGYVRAPEHKRSVYAGYVPAEPNDDAIYINSGIALTRFDSAAFGDKTLKRLTWSKQEHGDGNFGVDDSTIAWMTFGSMLLASVIGVPVFLLGVI